MTVAEAVAEWLAEKEITHAFGIIGAGNLSLWEAIERLGKTEIICCHHEQAAAFAASFYNRTSSGMAVVLVTTGAGSSNAITGVLSAYMDSTPLIVISGNETDGSLSGNTRTLGVQGYDSAAVAMQFTNEAFNLRIDKEYGVRASLDRALCTSQGKIWAKRQGPVWVNIARDIQVANV